MIQKQTFFFNGQRYYSQTKLTIFELLLYFGYSSALFIVEYNNFIYPKKNWKKTIIQYNDKIEIINIVGGG